MCNIMLKISTWNYSILNIMKKIRNIFENDTECEHDNVEKFLGKYKWTLLHTETFKRLLWAVSNKDNARKKYFKIKRLSSGDIFAFLDSVESDDEGDIENIINGSDTEFVAEDDSVLYYNQKKSAKKRSMTKLAPCQFQKHQFTFFYPKWGWKRYFRSGWTEFCSCHIRHCQSVTVSFHSTYFQSVTSCQSRYCQSVTCCCCY